MSFGRSTTFAFIGKDQFSSVADKVSRKSSGMGGKLMKAGKVAAVGFGAAAAGAAVLGAAGLKAIKVAEEQGTANAKLAKVMESMGYSENAKAAQDYADSIEQVIAVDSAEIKSGQTKLATFKDIAASQDLMRRSTMLTADMAAAGFGSISSNAVGLGKALQDPITGMSLLSRQGSLTKDEQKKIGDEFKRTGDKAAAQESILKALEKQTGGVAEASADSSVKMSLAFGEIAESIGKALQPAFDALVPVVTKVSDWVVKVAIPKMGEFGRKIMPVLRDAFENVKDAVEDARPQLEQLGKILLAVGKFVATKVLPVWIKWQAFIAKNLIKALAALGDVLPPIVSGFLRGLSKIIGAFKGFYSAVTGVLEGILTVAEKTMGWIPGIGDKIKTAKAGFANFRDDTVRKLGDVASKLDYAAQRVDAFKAKSDAAKPTKIKADISDLTAKLKSARTELQDPNLTKDRKAELKADISDLRDKANEAKSKLAEIKSKQVRVGVDLNFTKSGNPTMRLPSGKIVPLASGGIVTRPTLAMVGEAGPEAVIPLKPGGNGVGGTVVNININGGLDSSEAIARRVQAALLDYKRRQGVPLGLG